MTNVFLSQLLEILFYSSIESSIIKMAELAKENVKINLFNTQTAMNSLVDLLKFTQKEGFRFFS